MPKKETTKTTTAKTSTAIATAAPKTDYEMVMNQFFNIDFSAMNKVIDNLANRNSLSKVEKKEANAIIDTWNENVINKLNIEEEHIANFVAAITGASAMDGIPALIKTQDFIPELEALIVVAGLDKEYADMCDTVTEYTMAESMEKNLKAVRLQIMIYSLVQNHLLTILKTSLLVAGWLEEKLGIEVPEETRTGHYVKVPAIYRNTTYSELQA